MNDKDSRSENQRGGRGKDKVAHVLLYLGLGMSAVSICAAHVYHGVKRAYQKIKKTKYKEGLEKK